MCCVSECSRRLAAALRSGGDPDGLMPRSRPVLLAAFAYCALTLAYSWPLALNLAHGVAHDPGDPLLNAWILWWSTKAVPLSGHWWNAPMFYPAVGTLAFSEHLLGIVPIAAPFIAISHHPLLGYNIALLASYIFSGLGAYFLVYTLTRRHDAAFVGGLAFAFAPYRAAQLPHIQVLSAYWTPVCLAALHRYDGEPHTRWAALAAAAWLMQALACGYYLFFLTVLLSLWFLWFAVGRWSVRQFAIVFLAWTVAALLLMPVLEGYKHYLTDTYGFTRGIGSIRTFSADVGSLLHASDELWLWGWVHAIRRPEGELFPGPTIVGLAFAAVFATRPFSYRSEPTRRRWWLRRIFGATFMASTGAALVSILYGPVRLSMGGVQLMSVGRAYKPVTLAVIAGIAWMSTLPAVRVAAARRSPLAFYGLAAFAMWVFALGPDPTFFGYRALYQAPYGWLMRLPAFEGLRVPARFWMMTLVCLSVLAGFAVDRLRARTRRNLVMVAAVGLVLDGWPIFSVRPEPEVRPTPSGAAVRLDLPMTDERDVVALYRQTFDAIPLYNGFSGYGAPHQYAMRELLSADDPRILRALSARGPLGVLIDHAGDPAGNIRRYISSYPGAVLKQTTPAGAVTSCRRVGRVTCYPTARDGRCRSGRSELLHVSRMQSARLTVICGRFGPEISSEAPTSPSS